MSGTILGDKAKSASSKTTPNLGVWDPVKGMGGKQGGSESESEDGYDSDNFSPADIVAINGGTADDGVKSCFHDHDFNDDGTKRGIEAALRAKNVKLTVKAVSLWCATTEGQAWLDEKADQKTTRRDFFLAVAHKSARAKKNAMKRDKYRSRKRSRGRGGDVIDALAYAAQGLNQTQKRARGDLPNECQASLTGVDIDRMPRPDFDKRCKKLGFQGGCKPDHEFTQNVLEHVKQGRAIFGSKHTCGSDDTNASSQNKKKVWEKAKDVAEMNRNVEMNLRSLVVAFEAAEREDDLNKTHSDRFRDMCTEFQESLSNLDWTSADALPALLNATRSGLNAYVAAALEGKDIDSAVKLAQGKMETMTFQSKNGIFTRSMEQLLKDSSDGFQAKSDDKWANLTKVVNKLATRVQQLEKKPRNAGNNQGNAQDGGVKPTQIPRDSKHCFFWARKGDCKSANCSKLHAGTAGWAARGEAEPAE